MAVTTSYTGASAKNTLDLEPTWNTSGTMRGILVQVTHTAAGASSRAIDVKRGANTIFDIDITTNASENGVSVVGGAAGSGATVASIGTDTNVDLLLVAKGTGVVKADGVEVVTLTGTQTLTNKTLTTPTIASLANATHTHADAAGGGQLDWDTAFTDAAHNHSSAAEGGTSLSGLTAVTLASGQLTLPVGSAASPSLVFDSGNGVYSEGTDRLNFATAGTVRVEIDAAGSVGLGVTPRAWASSQRALQVGGAGAVVGNATSEGTFMLDNTYYDGTNNRSLFAAAASSITQVSGAITLGTAPSVTAGSVQTFTERMRLTEAGMLLVGDTTNAGMTVGLTINQGANDDEALALKSSDVAHAFTTQAEADTYLAVKKSSAAAGGAFISAYSESTFCLVVEGHVGAAADTTKAAASNGVINLDTWLTDGGTSRTLVGANGNLLCVRNGNTATRMIVDTEGDIHVDGAGTLTVYDEEDDAALLEAVSLAMDPSREKDFRFRLARDLAAHKETLIAGGILSEGGFVSYKGMLGLLIDAIRQVTHAQRSLEARVTPLLPKAS